MMMNNGARWVIAFVFVMLPTLVQAAGLGALRITSALGQPLVAEADVIALPPGEENTLRVGLASPEAFQRAGIEMSPLLQSFRFAVQKHGAVSTVRITSTRPIPEPFLDVLVELSWSSGRLVREYSFLLDPPVTTPVALPATPSAPTTRYSASSAEPSSSSTMVVSPTPAEATTIPRVTTAQTKPASARPNAPEQRAAQRIHRVQSGETLSAIAQDYLPSGAQLAQLLMAFQQANPEAFVDQNINRLRAGVALRVPSAQATLAIDLPQAQRDVRAQSRSFISKERSAPRTHQDDQTAAATVPAGATAAGEHRVRLARADASANSKQSRLAREDDATARERALKEAQSRVLALEKNVQDLQQVIAVRNQALAALDGQTMTKSATLLSSRSGVQPSVSVASEVPTDVKASSVFLIDSVYEFFDQLPLHAAAVIALVVLLIGLLLVALRRKDPQPNGQSHAPSMPERVQGFPLVDHLPNLDLSVPDAPADAAPHTPPSLSIYAADAPATTQTETAAHVASVVPPVFVSEPAPESFSQLLGRASHALRESHAAPEPVADFRLDFSTPAETAPASEPTSSTQPFDLSAIDLDLGETPIATPSTPWQEVTTKIALAQAYSEMGDVAGARELLNEALTEGDAEQQAQARALLDKVGAGVSS